MGLLDIFSKDRRQRRQSESFTAKKKIRARTQYNTTIAFLVIFLWVLSDPDLGLIKDMSFGSSTIASLLILVRSTLYVTLLHYSRKAMLDYLDLEVLFRNASSTSEGSGKAIVGVGLIMISIALVIIAATV